MRIDIISVVPDLLISPFDHSIMKRAQAKGLAEVHLVNLRDYSTDKHKTVDDYAFGGGAGMVMKIEPIVACIEDLKSKREYDEVIYMSPDGELQPQQVNLRNCVLRKRRAMTVCIFQKVPCVFRNAFEGSRQCV